MFECTYQYNAHELTIGIYVAPLVTFWCAVLDMFRLIIGGAAQNTVVSKAAAEFKVGQLGVSVDHNDIFGLDVPVCYSLCV